LRPTVVSADVLFEAFREKLGWHWVAGTSASERRFDEVAVRAASSGADLVGYLNYIHPYRIQLLGHREVSYLSNSSPEDCARRVARIVTLEPPVLILADGQVAPEALESMCERAQIPMFATRESSAFVIDILRAYLSKHFADRASMHGVFMDILGLGVMITGESGLGKSELGLELISRGNGLVADDAVDIYRINQTTLEGRCPDLLQNLLEVRGIGLLDIRAIFGETAVRRKMRLKLIVHLVRRETLERDYDRLPHEPLTQDVLGVPVRKVVIQVVAGRNIAVLVEAAVRNTILQLRGINTYEEFAERQRQASLRLTPWHGDGGRHCGCSAHTSSRRGLRCESPWPLPHRFAATRFGHQKTPRPVRSPGTPGDRGGRLR
jgi:HPr kinase/phosphorylase